jgi:hypothetical protein
VRNAYIFVTDLSDAIFIALALSFYFFRSTDATHAAAVGTHTDFLRKKMESSPRPKAEWRRVLARERKELHREERRKARSRKKTTKTDKETRRSAQEMVKGSKPRYFLQALKLTLT